MPLKTLDADVSNFESVLKQVESSSSSSPDGIKFLLFLADVDPSTNRSWCPDCIKAEPVIREKLSASDKDITLVRAYVGDRPIWRTPRHPWRIDPRFKLTGVPTLIRWEEAAIAGRLEDHEAHVAKKIDALLV